MEYNFFHPISRGSIALKCFVIINVLPMKMINEGRIFFKLPNHPYTEKL